MLQRTVEMACFLYGDPVRKVRTGQTPHLVVHQQNKSAVRYFPPFRGLSPDGRPVRRPLFVSMPLINTWTIFDLLPGKSVVETLVDAGVPVYLLDWGRPGPEDAEQTLSDVIDDMLDRAMRRSARHARALGHLGADEPLDALGYCVGGTFLAVGIARQMARGRRPVHSLALLAAPIDFHASGRLAAWARPESFPLDDIVDGFGNFPKELMASSFSWLKPMGQLARYRSLWQRLDDEGYAETWAAMEKWNRDNTDFPGEAYREYVRRCYFDNALMPGSPAWQLDGRPVDLSAADVPALAIAADRDHICPAEAAFGLRQAWGGPVRTASLPGGHVGVCLGSTLPRTILEWLDE